MTLETHCSVCSSPSSVVMLDIEFCGTCFRILSSALETRLTTAEMMMLLRGDPLSEDAQVIVSVVLSQLFRANAAVPGPLC